MQQLRSSPTSLPYGCAESTAAHQMAASKLDPVSSNCCSGGDSIHQPPCARKLHGEYRLVHVSAERTAMACQQPFNVVTHGIEAAAASPAAAQLAYLCTTCTESIKPRPTQHLITPIDPTPIIPQNYIHACRMSPSMCPWYSSTAEETLCLGTRRSPPSLAYTTWGWHMPGCPMYCCPGQVLPW